MCCIVYYTMRLTADADIVLTEKQFLAKTSLFPVAVLYYTHMQRILASFVEGPLAQGKGEIEKGIEHVYLDLGRA